MNTMNHYLARPDHFMLHAKLRPSRRLLAVQSLWQRGSAAEINDLADEPPLADPPTPSPGHDPDETPPTYDALVASAPTIESIIGGKR